MVLQSVRQATMRDHVAILWWTTTISLLTIVDAQSLPYNPTYILRPRFASNPRDIAYVFVPSGSNQQLVSLNISASLSPSSLVLDSVTPDLPFNSNGSSAFTPVVAENGEISVYTDTCNTSTASELWRFIPSNTSTFGNGTWAQEVSNTGSSITAQTLPGADFLSRGLAFSTIVQANASETQIYIFGGMCPTENSTAANWQSEASYSSSMLRFVPTTSTTTMTYTLDTASSRGAPIAEAGFAMTGLEPAYSNVTGVEMQQQSFVLIGGHTQTAFINMSQVAVWSLPEESWSFLTVKSPSSSSTNTELAMKSTVTNVDSRSGHSAVLSEDGSSIIVYGGWVGDITQAADPQLAILQLGTGYGGTGDWEWTVPVNQPGGTGIFGHGALMLPGNVMMVLGGYNITSSSNTKRAISAGTQALFFNATSMTWQTNYTNPNYIERQAAQAAQAASQAANSSRATKLGLGLGIGLGLLFVILALAFCCIYSRRLRKRNEENREKIIGELGTGSFYHVPNRYEESGSGVFPWANRGWNQGTRQDFNSAVDGYTNLQNAAENALDPVPPVPMPIKRKPLHTRQARGVYQPAGSFDFNNSSSVAHARTNSLGTAGAIHPIYEADEEQDGNDSDGYAVGIALGEPPRPMGYDCHRYSDPFKDGPSGSGMHSSVLQRSNTAATHSTTEPESPAELREREIQGWLTDWAAADLLLHAQTKIHSHQGRISPIRRAQIVAATTVSSVSGEEDSGRTESNLSDRSITHSGLSRSGSSSQGRERISRSDSLRGFITGINPFGSAPSTVGTVMSPVFDGPVPRSYVPPRSADSSSSTSFTTARSSFPALQAEGETLLPRPGDRSRSISPEREILDSTPGSPSKSRPSAIALGKRRGQAGWLGSLKRVFAGDDTSTMIGRRRGSVAVGGSSPTKVETTPAESGSPPRRTVSAGATLWRRKQGRGDWDDSEDVFSSSPAGYRASTFSGATDVSGVGSGGVDRDRDEEDWDIERAVQNRVVQVMFTVPKERLRIVNHDFEEGRSVGGGSAASSLRSKKGSGGTRSLHNVFVVPPVDDVADVDQGRSGDMTGEDQKMDPLMSLKPIPQTPLKKMPAAMGAGPEQDQTPGSGRSSPDRRKTTRVLEMVEKMEGRNSPERI